MFLYFADRVQAYIIVIVAELGFIIQYDTVQAPCDTLVQ